MADETPDYAPSERNRWDVAGAHAGPKMEGWEPARQVGKAAACSGGEDYESVLGREGLRLPVTARHPVRATRSQVLTRASWEEAPRHLYAYATDTVRRRRGPERVRGMGGPIPGRRDARVWVGHTPFYPYRRLEMLARAACAWLDGHGWRTDSGLTAPLFALDGGRAGAAVLRADTEAALTVQRLAPQYLTESDQAVLRAAHQPVVTRGELHGRTFSLSWNHEVLQRAA
jgi:hypothetical protein